MKTKREVFLEVLAKANKLAEQCGTVFPKELAVDEYDRAVSTAMYTNTESTIPSIHDIALVFAAADRANAQVGVLPSMDKIYEDARAFFKAAESWDQRY